MEPVEFERLVENIRKDGTLTSLPLLCRNEDGSLEILSGHHRIEAALKAGITEAECIIINTPLSEQKKTAIQLSHNAITGKDDISILRELYDSIDVEMKEYSGLDDSFFGEDKLASIVAATSASLKTERLEIIFLPSEIEEFSELLKEIERRAPKHKVMLAHIDDFDRVFDALVSTKLAKNVSNTAAAITAMAQLALERIEQIENDMDE